MAIYRVVAGLVLAAIVVGFPLSATAPIATPEVSGPAVAEPTLPVELEDLLLPAPIEKYGMKPGPCTVSVTCPGSFVISCSGRTVCYWKLHGPGSLTGFVECDGVRTTCQLN